MKKECETPIKLYLEWIEFHSHEILNHLHNVSGNSPFHSYLSQFAIEEDFRLILKSGSLSEKLSYLLN